MSSSQANRTVIDTPHILIVGAGIGGLTAALSLKRIGVEVSIFEQANRFEEVGAGLQLSANAMHVLHALGLSDEITARGFLPKFAALKHYASGKAYLTVPLAEKHQEKYGQPYVHIHRADLQDILVNAVKKAGINVHLGQAVNGFRQDGDKAEIKLGDQLVSGDLVIGADGVHSSLRDSVIGASKTKYSGYSAWRGLVSAAAMQKDLIGPGVTNWIGPMGHFVAYYLRGGDLINFVAVHGRPDWVTESWSQPGDVGELKTAFYGWDEPVQTLISACDNPFLWGLMDRDPLPQWTQGRLGLLGDAAHPMLPFMAQGAAMAIEDAWVLAHFIQNVPEALPDAIERYAGVRGPRTGHLQFISRSNADLYHAVSPGRLLTRWASLKLANTFPALQDMKFRLIYGLNVTEKFPVKSA